MNMQMTAVNSSMIREVGYDADSSTLRVTFTSGATWDYADISQEEYESMMHAPSVGKWFNANIKGARQGARV